ncbi:hypothetical protein S40285_08210 [Stachybotrys chlorohalonatus IBT 40285]|uniref:Uncharacterized protein n=1 Tax=Stachybotrys chlorohalonatus (strain IBT 40285) TaxID=1283841 RepID=A0A084R235_STAC4|nr:hypothetical protein S40285_08210 [Stachybotrys chlorohalonata IBT 40285]
MSLRIRDPPEVGQSWKMAGAFPDESPNETNTPTRPGAMGLEIPLQPLANGQRRRPEVAMRPSETSYFDAFAQSSAEEQPAKQLRFAPPTLQIRPSRYDKAVEQRSPDCYTSKGAYASESDNESLWSSSNLSTSTQATSVYTEDNEKAPVQAQRPSVLVRRQSMSAGSLTRQPERKDTRAASQTRTVRIQIEPKEKSWQSQPPVVSQKPTIRQAPRLTQASDHKTEVSSSRRTEGAEASDNESSALLQEITTLRSELRLRDKQTEIRKQDTQQIAFLRQEKHELKEEKGQLQLRNAELTLEIEDQAKQLVKAKSRAEKHQTALLKFETEGLELERIKNNHTEEVQCLREEHEQSLKKIKDELLLEIKKWQEECNLRTETQKTFDDKVVELNEQLEQYKEMKGLLEKRCEALEQETKQMTERSEQDVAKSNNLERELQDVIAIKKAQDIAYVSQIATLEMSMESMQLRVKGLQDDLVKNATELGELTAERDQLKLDISKDKSTMSDMEQTIRSLDEKVAALEKSVEEHKDDGDTKASRLKEMEEEQQRLTASLETIQQEKEAAEKQVKDIETKRKKLKKQTDTLKNEAKEATAQIELLQKEKDDTSSEVTRLTKECDGLREENESLRSDAGSSVAASNSGPDCAAESETAKAPDEAEPAPAEATTEPAAPADVLGVSSETPEETTPPVVPLTDEMAAKLATAEENAHLLVELRVTNGSLTAELEDANQKLTQTKAQLKNAKQQFEAEKKAHKTTNSQVTKLQAQLAKMQLESTDRGRSKTKSKTKKPEELLVVRCPRDGSRGISVVRRRNMHLIRSLSQSGVC